MYRFLWDINIKSYLYSYINEGGNIFIWILMIFLYEYLWIFIWLLLILINLYMGISLFIFVIFRPPILCIDLYNNELDCDIVVTEFELL